MLIIVILLTPCLAASVNWFQCNSRGGQILVDLPGGIKQCRLCSSFLNVATPAKALNLNKCVCISGHDFNTVKLICDPGCQKLQNTNSEPVNLTTGDCTCLSGFAWIKQKALCQFNCSLIANTVQTASTLQTCNCRIGFTYNVLTRSCDLNCTTMPYSIGYDTSSSFPSCHCQQGYMYNSTTSNCVLTCSTMPYVNLTASTATQCACQTNYIWNATSGLCQFNCLLYANTIRYDKDLTCLCLSGYIFSLQTPLGCIANCTTNNNAVSINSSNSLSCICALGYKWNTTERLCSYDCTLVRNATGQLSSYQCNCANGFSWNSLTLACQLNCTRLGMVQKNVDECVCMTKFKFNLTSLGCSLDCSQIAYAVVAPDNPKVCDCVDRIWYPRLLSCQIDCTTVLNAVGNLNDSHCECHSSFEYSTATGTCDLRCITKVLHSIGTVNTTTCVCQPYADWDQEAFKCLMDCTRVSRAISQLTENACSCQNGYVWNTYSLACYIDCSLYNAIQVNAEKCECQYGMTWSSQNICALDCSKPGALGLDFFDPTMCECLPGAYVWIADAKYCRPDCLLLPNTLIPDGYDGKPIDGVYCKCNEFFQWNIKIGACMLNCKQLLNTIEVERTINDVFLDPECGCRPNAVWNGLDSPGCTLQCDQIPNSSPNTNTVGDACICNTGYMWYAATSTCNLNCTTLSLKQLNPTTCQCPIGYDWNITSTKCQLNCDVHLSTGSVDPDDPDSCICQGIYGWYKPNLACVLDCKKITYSMYSSSTSLSLTGICTCIRGFNYNSSLNECRISCEEFANTDYQIPSTIVNDLPACSCKPNTVWQGHLTAGCALDCQTIFGSTGNNLNDRACQCSAGYAWNSSTNVCYLDCIKLNFPQGGINDCVCKPNYSWSSQKSTCVMDCAGKANSNQTVNAVFPDACYCNPKYAWSPITLTCLEDCSQIDFTHVVTTPQYFTLGVCSCLSNFNWDAATKSCIIDCSKYINVDQTLSWTMINELPVCLCKPSCTWQGYKSQGCYLNCSKVANSTGTQKDQKTCYCRGGFQWDPSTFTCKLTCSDLGMTQVSDTSCSCPSGFVWNLTELKCQPDCTLKVRSTGVRNDTNGDICVCQQNYSWSKVQMDCLLDCYIVAYTNTKVSPHFMQNNVCPCIEKFDFSQSLLKCSINCSKYINTIGQYSSFECSCQPSSSWQGHDSAGCILQCQNVQNSRGVRESDSVCSCQYGYYWNSSTFTCDLNCTVFQLTRLNATHCDCVDKQWNVQQLTCYRSCQNIQYGTGQNDETDVDACQCQQNYVWTPSSQCSFDCSAIPYSNTTTNPQFAVDNVCPCIEKFTYIDRKCIINCSLYDNTIDIVAGSYSQCKCKKASIWQGQNSAGCQLDCSSVANGNGLKINSTHCSCNNKYRWNPSWQVCHFDCSIVPNAIDVFYRTNSCLCIRGAHWDPLMEECILNCNKVPFSTGVSLSGVSCQCVQGYRWNMKGGSCIIV